MVKHRIEPARITPIEKMKGKIQFPVRSTTMPKISGETIAASAEPVFISPLAVPANLGAMSMGMAHIGPMVNSAQKKPALSDREITLMSRENNSGTMERQHRAIITATRLRRSG